MERKEKEKAGMLGIFKLHWSGPHKRTLGLEDLVLLGVAWLALEGDLEELLLAGA